MPEAAVSNGRTHEIQRVLLVVLGFNIVVAVGRLLWGIHSMAMQAAGIHSFFDGASNIAGLVGMWLASRPVDEGHPYGHRKFETFAAGAIPAVVLDRETRLGSRKLTYPRDFGEVVDKFVIPATLSAVPVIDEAAPSPAAPGTGVTITGSCFGTDMPKRSAVTINGKSVAIKSWSTKASPSHSPYPWVERSRSATPPPTPTSWAC
jgi:hypothetical protein